MPTDYMENTNDTNKGGDLLHVINPWTIPRGKKRIPQGNQKNWRSTIHWSTYPQGEQHETKNVAMVLIDNEKAYIMVPYNRLSQNIQNIQQT